MKRHMHRAAVLPALLAWAGSAASAAEPPRVTTASGVVEGVSTDGDAPVLAFKGIPYAESPAGAARWKPPRPVAPWTGVRSARELGPVCPQPDRESVNFIKRLTTALGGDPSWVPPLGPTSEDCLSLNVFTGGLEAAEPRPVMVWIHGGAYRFGSGKDQARALVPHGVVVVTLNYRLGLLGFLAHPALSEESAHGASGNYGLLDQIEALRWVQRNIAAFGGDPRRVTIFGHSAGGGSVAQLLASPLAKGLLHRAVIQSGGLGASRPRVEMEAEGLTTAATLGMPVEEPLPALRALPVEKLLDASNGPFGATADGWVIPAPGPGAIAGGGNDVPLLIGATTDEATVFAAPPDLLKSYRAAVGETGPTWQRQVAAQYPAHNGEQAHQALLRLTTDRDFVCPARYVAAKRRAPTWLYLFSAPAVPGPGGAGLGAFHGADVRLLFDLTYGVPQDPFGQKVGDTMRRYWARFAATGDPNAPGLASWPAYRAQSRYLELNEPLQLKRAPDMARCDLFDRVWDATPARP